MTDLTLNFLEQLIASEFGVGYEQDLVLVRNKRNPSTGLIEFATDKEYSFSGIRIEELIRTFYKYSGYNVSDIEEVRPKNIFKFKAENKESYSITILKTNYHNIIVITQPS